MADAMSYLAETKGPLDVTILAERLSDIAKGLIVGLKLTEAARVDLVCTVFKVPVSAARTEKGVSLLGSGPADGRPPAEG